MVYKTRLAALKLCFSIMGIHRGSLYVLFWYPSLSSTMIWDIMTLFFLWRAFSVFY